MYDGKDKESMRKICLYLLVFSLFLSWNMAAFADSSAVTAPAGSPVRVKADEKHEEDSAGEEKDHEKDHDDDDDDHREDHEEKDDDDSSSGSRTGIPAYRGTLSSYVPLRWSNFKDNWRTYVFESSEGDDDDGVPEYEATFSQGHLKQLGVEIGLDNGTEVEVVFDSNKKILRAEYETEAGEIIFDGSVWRNGKGELVEGPDLAFMEKYFDAYRVECTWYGYNTMSLVGLSLRDMYPNLTNRWYQVVPVDLTKEGRFYYPTAVSNMYYLGGCYVTVKDGFVTTDYMLPTGQVYPKSDCLMWFTDISEITTEFLESPTTSPYEFGKPVSIKDDLKGQDIALLFICNQVTFRVPLTNGGAMPVRYYRGQPKVQDALAEYEVLLKRMKK